LREPPYDTPLNRFCKPQIKLENTAAICVPVLAREHECAKSVMPVGPTWYDDNLDVRENLLRAVSSRIKMRPAFSLDDACKLFEKILK